ncbi:MAG: MBL fold metallo-hydrolase [Anaerolineae bacterium]|jgi:metallo-beta-lactamase family protein|nr:MBL fold metallo-hydrolase [Anaerolineae bacterium]
MQFRFFGAARTVTGSLHVIDVNGHRLVLDCGLFQGKRQESYERNLKLPVDVNSIDAVILSHAHIDHSGNLPNLVKLGYDGPIYCTPATSDLIQIMLLDAGHIQESDVEYINKKRKKRGQPLIEPLYTQRDADQVKWYVQSKNFYEEFEPVPGVKAEFVDAGHILGAASVSMEITEQGKSKPTRVWFSGDIGRFHQPLLPDPALPDNVDYLLMESTYGDKSHSEPEMAFNELRDTIQRTIKRGGKVIIPSFAIGRTQDLVYHLNRMVTSGDIPSIPVFVDSPLAVNATDIFRKYADTFDDEAKAFVHSGRHPALVFDKLTYTRSVEESKQINEMEGPLIIISASGMAEVGRILHHLKNNIEDERNTILIVGWQAPDTLGRRLADREEEVRIFGETYHRKAEVVTIGGLSAHAGQNLLVRYAQATKSTLKKVFLVHGEPKGALPLMEKFRGIGITQSLYPERGDVFDTDEDRMV